MRLRVIVIVALLTGGCASLPHAKNPCSGVGTHTDDFGKTTRGLLIYMDNNYRASGLIVEEGQLKLRVMFARSGLFNVVIPAATSAQVALADGTVITLATLSDAPQVTGANPAAVFTQWVLDLGLEQSQVDRLGRAPFKAIKIQMGPDELMVRPNDKKGDAMRYLAQCLAPDATFEPPAATPVGDTI